MAEELKIYIQNKIHTEKLKKQRHEHEASRATAVIVELEDVLDKLNEIERTDVKRVD